NAARLWVDWLTSDEGSEQYALGGAIPARFTELAEAGKLSDEALDNLPDPEILEKVELPTPEQGDRKSTRLNSSHVSISYAVFCFHDTRRLHAFPTRRSSDLTLLACG